MFIALFLKGFERQIRENILSGMVPSRREMSISIGSYEEMPDDLQKFVAPHLTDDICAVTRPTDIGDSQVPIFVCCRGDIGDDWGVGSGKGGSLQVLFGYTIAEVIFAMLHGEVEMETLRPKNRISDTRNDILNTKKQRLLIRPSVPVDFKSCGQSKMVSQH